MGDDKKQSWFKRKIIGFFKSRILIYLVVKLFNMMSADTKKLILYKLQLPNDIKLQEKENEDLWKDIEREHEKIDEKPSDIGDEDGGFVFDDHNA